MQLCYLRYPGFALPTDAGHPSPLLDIVGRQLRIEPDIWPQYAQRPETRREHLLELQAWLKLTPFTVTDYRHFVHQLADLAQQTDRGIVLAEALIELLRQQRIILRPSRSSSAWQRGADTRHAPVYEALTAPLGDFHRRALDGLLAIREGTKGSGLIWLRQPPGPAKPEQPAGPPPRTTEDPPRPGAAGRPGTRHSPEPPAEARPRGRTDDRPATFATWSRCAALRPWSR